MADPVPDPASPLGKATTKALEGSSGTVVFRWALLCLLLYALLKPVSEALVRHLDAATANIEKHIEKTYPE